VKHNLKVVGILIALFLLAQFVGLIVAQHYFDVEVLPLGFERPEVNVGFSFLSLFIFIISATILILVLLKFKMFRLWKFWFLISIFYCLTVSFGALFSEITAIFLGLGFALWRILKPNVIIHNFTEVFLYGALAAIFSPILNIYSIVILLLLISVYDYIAVCKTKHMIKMAESQSKAKVFAGLLVPYGKNVAILGGGDIGFPLLFSGVVMIHFGLGLFSWQLYLVPLFSAIALFGLFYFGNPKKYYPAMPFVTLGCLLALLVISFV